MWKILQCHVITPIKSLFSAGNLQKSVPHVYKINVNIVKKSFHSSAKKLECKNSWHYGLGLGFGVITNILVYKSTVYCKAHKNRLTEQRKLNQHAKFDWHKLFKYLRPHKWILLIAVASAMAVAFLNVYIPQMIGVVVNILANIKHSGNGDFLEQIKGPAFKLIGLYAGQAFFTFMYIFLLAEVGEKVASQMKQDLFVSILKQDMAFFDSERTGELVNRLTVDVQDFKSSFKQTISGGMRAITQLIGSSITLLLISPQLTGLTMVCVPSVIIGGTFIGSLLRKLSREAQEQVEKATLVAEEAISNMRTVRAFNGEENEAAMFKSECERAELLNRDLGLGIGLFQAGTNLFLNGLVLSTLFVGGHLMASDQLSAGDVMAFLVSAQTIQRSVTQISLLFGAVIKGISAGSRVFEYINKKPVMDQSGKETIKYHELRGDIQFKDVTFAYPTRPNAVILKDFNLVIPGGKVVAIVGSSGNGKSTIAALLERFYDVKAGSVSVDGVDVRALDSGWLRGRAIGYISQEPVLFATSVMENIRYGKPEATDDEVYRAAKMANAHDFIVGFPDGYRTVVGERGLALSGGQKQRVAIARAMIKNPPILILDEATSALDTGSEQLVQKALEEASKGRTVLVIAHRLSTIKAADLIVVLNKGQIAEMGTHEVLKAKGGFYWKLIEQQEFATQQDKRP